jgi:hypothetical protein
VLKVDEARKDPTSNPTFSATTRNALGRHGTAKYEEQLVSWVEIGCLRAFPS